MNKIRKILEKYIENEYRNDGSIEYQFIHWGNNIDKLEKELEEYVKMRIDCYKRASLHMSLK